MICADSSVAAKWAFVEEHSSQARALLRDVLQQQEVIVAPPLLPSEVQAPEMLYDRALVLADEYALPAVYDAISIALAELGGADQWTGDQRLLHTLGGRLPFVRSIAAYRA